MCTSFKAASHELCSSLANVARRMCTSPIHPTGLNALVACRLILLNKCPGVRPIGVGEVVRRIISKAVLKIVSHDIQAAAGSLQVCAGQKGGCEAAIHAMRHLFTDNDTKGVLLVDASNAFNSLNRKAALHNMRFICPAVTTILTNTYQSPVRMFINGKQKGEISSTEGTTQGDPLAMAMYALAVTPLIQRLHDLCQGVKQVWYADDATGAATCHNLRDWWDKLSIIGPPFGYHPNASKTYLVVKEEHEGKARQIFANTAVNITTQGKRHLGAAIGSNIFTEEYVSNKVTKWTQEVQCLAEIAKSQPHAAYAAFCHGLSSKWLCLSRTISGIQHLLQPLETTIRQNLIPAITGRVCSDLERDMLALPPRLGGLGMISPATNSESEFKNSIQITAPLAALIIVQETRTTTTAEETSTIKSTIVGKKREKLLAEAELIKDKLPPSRQRLFDCATEKGASSWLSVLPTTNHGFNLHKGAFRDALCLRYGWQLPNLPQSCICGASFTVDHAMICHKGGFPTIRHNEIRDISASLLNEVCHNVGIEPSLQPLSGETFENRTANTSNEARVDIRARGFWNKSQDAFFDVRVFHPNAPSYRSKDLTAIYKKHESDKKREYGQRVREIEHGVFTPLVFSSSGGMGRECTIFCKRLASMLADRQSEHYSKVLGWLRCRLSFALLRSAIMSIRGTRSLFSPRGSDSNNISLATCEGKIPSI